MSDPNWDVFISHASEDKSSVARPLADILRRAGLRVWIDAHEREEKGSGVFFGLQRGRVIATEGFQKQIEVKVGGRLVR